MGDQVMSRSARSSDGVVSRGCLPPSPGGSCNVPTSVIVLYVRPQGTVSSDRIGGLR